MRTLGRLALVSFLVSLASCGGSSSETPPPLEPLPVNMHYNRSATTLPGELGPSAKPAPSAAAEPEEPVPSATAKPAAKPAPPPRSQF